MSKHRMYSVPYNGSNPDWFVNEVLKRQKYIDHVFCELPLSEMMSHNRYQFNDNNGDGLQFVSNNINRSNYIMNCISFLRASEGKFRRICTVNAMYYKFDSIQDLLNFVLKICKSVEEYRIDGLILTDYRIALLVRKFLPSVVIHTSCNGYHWHLKQMEIWRDKIGVEYFNPPREILRTPSKLKEMKEAGFKLKCIVNEGCLVGCPNSFCHQLGTALNCYEGGKCIQNGLGDIFRGNWIIPRWQKYYDKYVDIYKIAGRNSAVMYPFFVLDAFIHERNDLVLSDIMMSGCIAEAQRHLPKEVLSKITLNKVPDKLLTCECRECKKCGLCDKLANALIPVAYRNSFVNEQFVLETKKV